MFLSLIFLYIAHPLLFFLFSLGASYAGHAEAVAILLSAGADDTIKNSAGLTPRQEAAVDVLDVYQTKDQGKKKEEEEKKTNRL